MSYNIYSIHENTSIKEIVFKNSNIEDRSSREGEETSREGEGNETRHERGERRRERETCTHRCMRERESTHTRVRRGGVPLI